MPHSRARTPGRSAQDNRPVVGDGHWSPEGCEAQHVPRARNERALAEIDEAHLPDGAVGDPPQLDLRRIVLVQIAHVDEVALVGVASDEAAEPIGRPRRPGGGKRHRRRDHMVATASEHGGVAGRVWQRDLGPVGARFPRCPAGGPLPVVHRQRCAVRGRERVRERDRLEFGGPGRSGDHLRCWHGQQRGERPGRGALRNRVHRLSTRNPTAAVAAPYTRPAWTTGSRRLNGRQGNAQPGTAAAWHLVPP
jgi:hypothetical protein